MKRGAAIVAAMVNGKPITSDCAHGVQNWNAWVGSASGGAISPVTVTQGTACVAGTGPGQSHVIGRSHS